MLKKNLFISLFLFGLIFSGTTEKCFADALAQLAQAKRYQTNGYYQQAEAIYKTIVTDYPGTDYALKAQKKLAILYVLMGKDSEAQATIDKLIADFSEHPDLPQARYKIARRYEWSGKYEKAKSIYQQIIQQYPADSCASKARLGIPRTDVLFLIVAGKDSGAQAALDKLIADFPGHSALPEAIYSVARRYEWSGKYEKAKSLYQQIIQQYPNGSYPSKAQLDVPKTDVLSLIVSGDDSEAQAALDKLVADFPGHSGLPAALYSIARRNERSEKYEKAKSLYQQITQQHAGTTYAGKAQLDISKTNVLSLAESGKNTEAQAVIDQLIADFPGHSHLPAVLYDIARRYEWSGKYEKAKSLYQQIMQQYSDSPYASKSQLNATKLNIQSLIEAGEDTAARAGIDQLIADFPGHSVLPAVVSHLAGQYANKANNLEKEGLAAQARAYFQKAVAIWEIVINELPGSPLTPQACCYVGDYYRKLGEYEKSIEYYQKAVDDYPEYDMAWHALFMVGHNTEALKESGVMSKSEADRKITAAYEQLLEKYPDCKAAKIARRWLSQQVGNN